MRILVACEFSGRVRDAFSKYGHYVLSCDYLESETSGNHYQGDVMDLLNEKWDLMIAHPPCTYLCNSGVRYLHKVIDYGGFVSYKKDTDRWNLMELSAKFFKKLLQANISKIAIENPIPHKYAVDVIGCNYNQLIQPWMFGCGETKATCLWLKNLPNLIPTEIVSGRKPRVHFESPSCDRWKNRSRTYYGIAEAMAIQWGKEII